MQSGRLTRLVAFVVIGLVLSFAGIASAQHSSDRNSNFAVGVETMVLTEGLDGVDSDFSGTVIVFSGRFQPSDHRRLFLAGTFKSGSLDPQFSVTTLGSHRASYRQFDLVAGRNFGYLSIAGGIEYEQFHQDAVQDLDVHGNWRALRKKNHFGPVIELESSWTFGPLTLTGAGLYKPVMFARDHLQYDRDVTVPTPSRYESRIFSKYYHGWGYEADADFDLYQGLGFRMSWNHHGLSRKIDGYKVEEKTHGFSAVGLYSW